MTTAEEQTSGFTVTHVRQACKFKLSCNRDQSCSRISFSNSCCGQRLQSDAAFVTDVGGKRHPLHSDARRMWLEPDCPCSTVPEVITRTLCTLICTTHSPLTRISSVGMLVNAHSDRKPPDDRR